MKTFKLIGVALLTVLMCVGFSSCSKSDDDNGGGGSSASIEGTWFLKSEIWYDWNETANQPVSTPSEPLQEYGDYAKKMTWVITKQGNDLICKKIYSNGISYTYTYRHASGNEYYQWDEESGIKSDKIVFKSVSDKQMVVEIYDGFYRDHISEYGIMTFMR